MKESWLTKEMDRRKALLYILLFSNYEISMDRLVSLLRVDKKTVEADLEFINTTWSETLMISTSNNVVTLQESPCGYIQDVFLDIVNESVSLNILEAILLRQCTSIEELSEKFYLSISTIRRILKQINKNLSGRGITINLRNLKVECISISVSGMFYFYFFIEKNGFLNWPFESIDQDALLYVIENSCQLFDFHFSKRFKYILSYYMAITLQAEELIIIFKENDKCFFKSMETQVTNYILDVFDYSFTDEMLNKVRCIVLTVLCNMHEFINSKKNRDIVQKFSERITMNLKITLDSESFEKLMFVFAYISFTNKLYPYDHFLVFDRDYVNSYSIKKYFPQFVLELEKGFELIEKEIGIPCFGTFYNVLIHDIFIIWKNLPQKILANRNSVPIAIVTPLDIEYLNIIEFFVLEAVGKRSHIILRKEYFSLEDYELLQKELDEAQVIITNKKLERYKEKQFVVNDVPNDQQLKRLKKRVKEFWIN